MTSWGWDVPPEPERWLPTPPMPSRWTFMEACTCPCCAVERAQRRSDQFFAQPANTPTVVRPPAAPRPLGLDQAADRPKVGRGFWKAVLIVAAAYTVLGLVGGLASALGLVR